MLVIIRIGNTATATSPITVSVTMRYTPDTISNSTVDVANGIGAITRIVVSVSTPPRAISWPSGKRWCQGTGCSTSRSATRAARVSAIRYCVIVANVRRVTTPAARSNPTPTIMAHPVTTVDVSTWPSSKRGTITSSITHRTANDDATVHSAYTNAPATAIVNLPACRLMIALRNPR
jgi:hypothetical protein